MFLCCLSTLVLTKSKNPAMDALWSAPFVVDDYSKTTLQSSYCGCVEAIMRRWWLCVPMWIRSTKDSWTPLHEAAERYRGRLCLYKISLLSPSVHKAVTCFMKEISASFSTKFVNYICCLFTFFSRKNNANLSTRVDILETCSPTTGILKSY